ncbi:hypothetical protein PRIEUP_LOCUS1728 [Pristimantis euphronides]
MDMSDITEKILKLTLEIIYLLTGEDYSVVNKTSKHVRTIHATSCQPRGLLCKTVCPITDPPPLSDVRENNSNRKILEVTKKIIQLLTGEVPVRCEDVIVCFSMEEWEYVEGHRDLYKHLMMENRPYFGSSDFPSSENLSKKLNVQMLSPDTTCEDHSSTLCKSRSKSNVFEDVEELTLGIQHEQLANTSTCIKCTQTEPFESGKQLLCEDKAHVVSMSTENTLMGYSSSAFRSYKEGDNKDSNFCLLTEQMQSTPDQIGSEVESVQDGIVAFNNIYKPTYLKSTTLTGRSTEWATNLNYVEYPVIAHNINTQDASKCIIEVATVCEDDNFTSTGIYTPTDHKSILHASDKIEEIPMSWGKDIVYTNIYAPEELTQVDLTSIKKELVSLENESLPLQNICIPPKPMEEKAVSVSSRGDAVQWNRHQAKRVSYSSLENASPNIKTEYDQGDFANHPATSGKTQPTNAPDNPEDCNKAIKTENMSVRNYTTNSENNHGRAAYAESQMYCCSDCKKWFSNDRNLANHRLVCRGRKPHVCSSCGKCFASASYLVIHERIHTGEKPYSCSHCGKSFTRKPDLIRHERIHTGEKPFSCPECGKRFTSVSNIFMHRRIHTGEKPFPCAECGKRFIKKSDLVRHEKIHVPQKPLPCSECGNLFGSKSILSKHMALHTADKPETAQGGS